MERNDVIITLEVLRANCSKHSRDYQALEYAISSLKTDETYQFMYEGVKIYTQDEVVDMLDKIKSKIKALHSPISGNDFGYGYISGFVDSSKIVQEQINALKEDKNEIQC